MKVGNKYIVDNITKEQEKFLDDNCIKLLHFNYFVRVNKKLCLAFKYGVCKACTGYGYNEAGKYEDKHTHFMDECEEYQYVWLNDLKRHIKTKKHINIIDKYKADVKKYDDDKKNEAEYNKMLNWAIEAKSK